MADKDTHEVDPQRVFPHQITTSADHIPSATKDDSSNLMTEDYKQEINKTPTVLDDRTASNDDQSSQLVDAENETGYEKNSNQFEVPVTQIASQRKSKQKPNHASDKHTDEVFSPSTTDDSEDHRQRTLSSSSSSSSSTGSSSSSNNQISNIPYETLHNDDDDDDDEHDYQNGPSNETTSS